MLKIGLVDLDTSHARSFARILQDRPGVQLAGVWDAQRVRRAGQVERFCEQFECRRFESVEALARQVDAAMVLSADWEVHLDRLAPLLKSGTPTYVDKPIAGSVAALQRYVELANETGTPVLTGSGWRYNTVMDAARQHWAHAKIDSAHAVVADGLLYYGVHAMEALLGLLGPGVEKVERADAAGETFILELTHRRGTRCRVLIGGSTYFRGVAFESGGAGRSVTFGAGDIHQGVCDALLAMVSQGAPPLPVEQQTEAVRVLLAARQSLRTGSAVALDELDPSAAYPSDQFMRRYIQQSRLESLLGPSIESSADARLQTPSSTGVPT